MVAMCEYCHAVRLYYVKKNSLGSNPSSHREDLFFFMNKIAIIIMPYRNRAHPFAVNVHRKVLVYRRICTYTCVPNREVIAMFGMDRDPVENLTQTFELERMLSYLNKDLDRQRLCHLKYVYIVT